MLDLLQHASGSLIPSGAVFGPLAENAGKSEAEDHVAGHGTAAMGHRIDLQKAWPIHVVVICSNRDQVFEQAARTGAAKTFTGIARPDLLEQPVNARWADLQQLGPDIGGQSSVSLLVKGQP